MCAEAYDVVKVEGVNLWIEAFVKLKPTKEVAELPLFYESCLLKRFRVGDIVEEVRIAGLERAVITEAWIETAPLDADGLREAGYRVADESGKLAREGELGTFYATILEGSGSVWLKLREPLQLSEEAIRKVVLALKREIERLGADILERADTVKCE